MVKDTESDIAVFFDRLQKEELLDSVVCFLCRFHQFGLYFCHCELTFTVFLLDLRSIKKNIITSKVINKTNVTFLLKKQLYYISLLRKVTSN